MPKLKYFDFFRSLLVSPFRNLSAPRAVQIRVVGSSVSLRRGAAVILMMLSLALSEAVLARLRVRQWSTTIGIHNVSRRLHDVV